MGFFFLDIIQNLFFFIKEKNTKQVSLMQRRFQKSNYATLINLKKDLVPSALVFTIQRAISVF